MARIVHEGMDMLSRKRVVPAKAIKLKFGAEIEGARHTVKLLDDNQKLYDGVFQDFERIDQEHSRAQAIGRHFELEARDGRVFTTTRSAQFQHASQFGADHSTSKEHATGFGTGVGEAAAVILLGFGHEPEYSVLPVNEWGAPPTSMSIDRTTYFKNRFEHEFPLALKDILCFIEGSVNSCLYVFKPVEGPFSNPVFRVQFVTASHALSSLDEVRRKYPHLANNASMRGIGDALDSPESTRIGSLRPLRNRCMHYSIPGHLTGLGQSLPMYGLIESTSPGHSYASVNADLQVVLAALSDALCEW
ncbi:hypothetical protein [Arthrobacter glacialis]|nr:hypothetical protein [Arthrobacter glacialis]